MEPPPPSLRSAPNYRTPWGTLRRLFVAGVVIAGLTLAVLRLTGLLRPFYVPTGAMTPAVSAKDSVLMEGVTYLFRRPQRGDIVVFKTDDVEDPGRMPKNEIFNKRLAGLPGERLRIAGGKLFVNGVPVSFANAAGEISLVNTGSKYLATEQATVTIPEGQYFVLGDNSPNSFDSRYFGFVPAKSIIGRIVYCYSPPGRIGWVH